MISRLGNSPRSLRLALIAGIAFLNLAGLFHYAYHLLNLGYLPSPFIYDKSDTFMDLFNTMYWAYDDGRYTEWRSVYPPVAFLILRLANVILAGGWASDPFIMRANSPMVAVGFVVASLALPVAMLALDSWKGLRKGEKLLLYVTLVSSSPMLFALERGNLIALCPVLLAIVLYKTGIARSSSIALLINIKPYFAVLLAYYLIRKDWRGFASCTMFSGLLFGVSGLLLDDRFLLFFANLFAFSQEEGLFALREVVAMPSSISAFSYALRSPDGLAYASQYLDQSGLLLIASAIEGAKWLAVLAAATILVFRSPAMRDAEIFCLLVVALTNLGVWVGGYSLVLYIALIPCLAGMRHYRIYLTLLACIAAPLDWIPLATTAPGWLYSFLSDSYVSVEWTLGLGSLARPSANLLLLGVLCYEASVPARFFGLAAATGRTRRLFRAGPREQPYKEGSNG